MYWLWRHLLLQRPQHCALTHVLAAAALHFLVRCVTPPREQEEHFSHFSIMQKSSKQFVQSFLANLTGSVFWSTRTQAGFKLCLMNTPICFGNRLALLRSPLHQLRRKSAMS